MRCYSRKIFPFDNLCDVTKWRENFASSIILVKSDVWSERGFEKVTYFDFYEFQMQQEKLRRSFVALFNLFHGLCSHAFYFSKNAIRKFLPKWDLRFTFIWKFYPCSANVSIFIFSRVFYWYLKEWSKYR